MVAGGGQKCLGCIEELSVLRIDELRSCFEGQAKLAVTKTEYSPLLVRAVFCCSLKEPGRLVIEFWRSFCIGLSHFPKRKNKGPNRLDSLTVPARFSSLRCPGKDL